jgi:hypothetical protein
MLLDDVDPFLEVLQSFALTKCALQQFSKRRVGRAGRKPQGVEGRLGWLNGSQN